MWHFVTLHRFFDTCRILAVLLIVPTRLADSRWQWVFASIAVICNGMKLLHYFAVLKYVNMCIWVLKFYLGPNGGMYITQ